jgi:hypothetical protein
MRKSKKSHYLLQTLSVGLKKTRGRNKRPSCNFKIDYESFLKNVGDVSYLLNDQGYFVFIEQVLAECHTLSSDHLLGLHFSDIVPLMDRELVRKKLAKVMRGGKLPPFALGFGLAGGTPVVLEFVIEAIRRGNEVIGAIGSSRILMRHESWLARAGSPASHANLDDESMVVMDVNENLLHLRDSFVQMHAHPSEGPLAGNLSKSSRSDSILGFGEVHQLKKGSGDSGRDKRQVLTDGSELRSLASRSNARDDDWSPAGMIAEKTDMGELKSIQEKLGKVNVEMKFQMERKMKQLKTAKEFLVKEKLER